MPRDQFTAPVHHTGKPTRRKFAINNPRLFRIVEDRSADGDEACGEA
jgi:hypothetical protein